ncbi:MAG TPA: nitroreductase family protein [Candidatus Competibacteraceae bacterium]|nr:nitroreductase family protein [Candidatus Competibacteraceae bacterium]MCP5134936.1 nitroreductase family protein [Gammaproteobacteria bacterium]HPF58852.1 nitroreductase family protein [Candidatus Competibacteraceae bacterium]HRY18186.1 nitroreductase family protein [Candidatus Competibacteraceae bacterium]
MWDFFETVRHRHSVRKYQLDMPVEPEKLHAILEMACAAPSAGDLQAYRIIVVSDPVERQALAHAAHDQTFIAEAPICLVFCADPARSATTFGERGAKLYALQDTTIAAAYAQLAIVAAGMGSTWVGYFEEAQVCQILELESGLMPLALLCLGYPAELPEPSSRRRLDTIAVWR